MIRILHAALVESGDGKVLDLELFLNQVRGIFKPGEEGTEDYVVLQAALLAQVRKPNYENRGAAVQVRTVPKKNSDPRNQRPEYQDSDKHIQLVLDMKAEMGSLRKAMIWSGILFDKLPNEQKQKNTSTNGKQKNNFPGTAKKRNRKDKMAKRSLVAVEEKDSVSDANEDTQLKFAYELSTLTLGWLEWSAMILIAFRESKKARRP
jgi:hypothetical protein